MPASLQLCLPRQYSVDLHWRAIWLVVLRKCRYKSVATTLFLSERSVRRYCELYRLTGAVEPTKYRHGPKKLLNDNEMIIVIHKHNHDIKQAKYVFGRNSRKTVLLNWDYVHVSTICRTVQYLGFTRKKLQHIALQCDDNLRGKFMAEISTFEPAMSVWVDESGHNRIWSQQKEHN